MLLPRYFFGEFPLLKKMIGSFPLLNEFSPWHSKLCGTFVSFGTLKNGKMQTRSAALKFSKSEKSSKQIKLKISISQTHEEGAEVLAHGIKRARVGRPSSKIFSRSAAAISVLLIYSLLERYSI